MRSTATSNVAAVAKEWRRLKKDYEKTLVSGLNKTAFRVAKEDMPDIMREGIDRPAKFTTNKGAGRYRRARINNPVAEVYLGPIQTEYLQLPVFGGRGYKGKAVPVTIPLNKYGNIPSLRKQKKVDQLLAKPDYFAKTFGDVSGIFNKVGRRLVMDIYFSRGDYKQRKTFDWHKGVRKYADKRLPKEMNKAINKTISRYAA